MSRLSCLRVEQRDDVCIVHLEGQGSVAEALREELATLLATVGPRNVLVDLHGNFAVGDCQLFSATFKGEMVRFNSNVKARGGALRICGMCNVVRDAFRASNLDGTLLAIYDSAEEALVDF